jgi:hypothetical protein
VGKFNGILMDDVKKIQNPLKISEKATMVFSRLIFSEKQGKDTRKRALD